MSLNGIESTRGFFLGLAYLPRGAENPLFVVSPKKLHEQRFPLYCAKWVLLPVGLRRIFVQSNYRGSI
jgi:hypothetical protein